MSISTDPLFTSWIFEMLGWRMSLVERSENEKGSRPEYGFQSLSLISKVSVATSPSLSGDLATSENVISSCVMKCSAISLRLSNSSDNFLLTEVCETTTRGTVGVTTGVVGVVGIVGCVGVTTGVVGAV